VSDEKLGVHEFQTKYFQGRPIYLDEARVFYEALGNRKLTDSFKFSALLKPWQLYSSFKQMGRRLAEKKVEGNMAGEGIIQGGIIVFGPGNEGIVYSYQEVTGNEVPLDEFAAGLSKLLECRK
jgi:hypothetical protein